LRGNGIEREEERERKQEREKVADRYLCSLLFALSSLLTPTSAVPGR